MKCFVPSCGIDFHKRNLCADGLVSKHRFPRNPERRLRWLDAIPNVGHIDPETINYSTVRLCSKHFHRDCFIITDNKRELLSSAVPSIFIESGCESAYYQEFYVISDGKVEIAQPSEQLYYQEPTPAVKQYKLKPKTRKRPIRYPGDIVNGDITPKEAMIIVPKLIAKLDKSNKMIRALRATNRRLREKMNKFEDIISRKFEESCKAPPPQGSNKDKQAAAESVAKQAAIEIQAVMSLKEPEPEEDEEMVTEVLYDEDPEGEEYEVPTVIEECQVEYKVL